MTTPRKYKSNITNAIVVTLCIIASVLISILAVMFYEIFAVILFVLGIPAIQIASFIWLDKFFKQEEDRANKR